jgi:hypothetical protein
LAIKKPNGGEGMKIITFPQWLNTLGVRTWSGRIDELPSIILNPIFIDLYNDEYAGDNLSLFLKDITDNLVGKNHYEIIRQLSDRGITTRGVGGGHISDNLYEYMDNKDIYNPINEYLINNKIRYTEGVSFSLIDILIDRMNWRGWAFPIGMFVFVEEEERPYSINWPLRNPMEVKE